MNAHTAGPHRGVKTGHGTCDNESCWCHEDLSEPDFECQIAEPIKTPPSLRYMAGTVDKKIRGGYQGEVELIRDGGIEQVAVVFGKTLEEMRHRKNLIVATLRCPAAHIKM